MRMAELSLQSQVVNDDRDSRAMAFIVRLGAASVPIITIVSVAVAIWLALAGVANWWAILALPGLTVIPRIVRESRRKSWEGDDAPADEG